MAKKSKCEISSDAVIKEMVDRFLMWKLPTNFSPDAGISFDKTYAEKWGGPSGTNLFDANQAEVMVRYIIGATK